MKIGILTHQYINNYGAFLQAYALREAVAEMFPDDQVEIINYMNVKHSLINILGWFRFYKDRENFKAWKQKIRVPRNFSNARKNQMVMSPVCFTLNQVNKQRYDCILVGSDEVWNFKDKKSNNPIKFGIGLECSKLIAYAPSVGKSEYSSELPKYVTEGLNKFKAISARDQLTFELVSKVVGKEPTIVLDPTFLHGFPIEKAPIPKKPYILLL